MNKEVLARTLLIQSYPNCRKWTLEELFIAYLLTKQLCDLCETGCAIINELTELDREQMPSKKTLMVLKEILSHWYSNDMFVESKKYGVKPDWHVVESFDKSPTNPAWILYILIIEGITPEIVKAVENRDRNYFYNNFDSIFAKLPQVLSDSIGPFKNFIKSKVVSKEDRETVFDFFQEITVLITDRNTTIENLKTMKK
jgi:hypothetical protein